MTSFDVTGSAACRRYSFIHDINGEYNFYSLSVLIGNLGLHDVGEIFHELIGIKLELFDADVSFDDTTLFLSSTGISIAGVVTINGHTSARGTLQLSKDGITISGRIGDLEYEGLIIREAEFDVFIASEMDTHCARASHFKIAGDLSLCGIDVKAGLFLDKGADGDLRWIVYGEAAGDIRTVRLAPELEGTFLDVSLNRLALIASNYDAPMSSQTGIKYDIVKGVQFCAAVDRIPALESLLRGSVEGMILRASYADGKLSLALVLPATRTISFSDSVYSGPLAIAIEADGVDVKLTLKALLNMHVDGQPDDRPLQLELGLKADFTAASAYAQMRNDWVNPCNLGQKVVIRKCALEFGIVYTTFLATGTPGEIGLAGELAIGRKMAGVAMKLSQNPKQQLLTATITDLGVADLVHFASLVVGKELPQPDDFIHFNQLDLYISTGASIASTYYPAGVSLKGNMTLFGKCAQFEASIGKRVKIMGTIEHFSLGPLTVRGATKPDPIVDVELSEDTQCVLIDGAVDIWDASAELHLEVTTLPETAFNFFVKLRLSDLFLLKLEARLSNSIDIKNYETWGNADFEVHGLMEQHLIDHVTGQLEQQLSSAQKAATEGFATVKADMDRAEAAFKASCQVAIDKLEEKRREWHAKKAEVDGAFERTRNDVAAERKRLQDKVDEAEDTFNRLINEKKAELQTARAEAAAAIRSAEHDLDTAQNDSDNAIREAQADLQRTRESFERDFGSAERDVEGARHDVEITQRRVDDLGRDIDDLGRQIDDEPWYRCPPLIAERAGLEIARGTAYGALEVVRGFLFAAEAVVHGTGFVAAEGGIGAAELTLISVRAIKTVALDVAKDSLTAAKVAHDLAIQAAEEALELARTASEELHVFDLAKAALAAGEAVVQASLNTAQAAVDGLSSCAEFVAFDTAEAALKFAQANTSELNLARHAVDLVEDAVEFGLDIGKWAVEHAGKAFNIRKVEFSGSVRSLTSEDGPPLTVKIQGTVLGHDIDLDIVWKPRFDLIKFIKELFALLWEKLKALVKEMF
ncbi:hypothetical protein GGX14DRAFT_611121 [Mycena pura]|uniref:Uncharacterized protein n=1 Tax=Mycena pura TaxID=153505 RepID=A0AAD6YHU2_9AGAR|nr:hypothetical protein GGX14DRAFT_611121 [Mycena pura]